jgi:UDP-glucose:tetrahydrobiopterin glucosyltransferase
LRIALVAPLVSAIAQPYLGGAQAMLADLAQRLALRGHSVTLFARRGSSVPGVIIEPIDVPDSVQPTDFSIGADLSRSSMRPPFNPDNGFFAQANLFLALFLALRRRSQEFDVIHAHAFDWPAFVCSALVRDIPVIHTLHVQAIVPEINAALRALHEQGHSLTLVTVSHACARTYTAYTPLDYVIYNGIDLDAIPFSPRVPSDAPLLFAGRITPEKGVEAAIAIAHRAGRRLLIAGGIYDQRYFDERISPLLQAAGESVTYLGQLQRAALWEIMGQVSGLLFPSTWNEPFGLAAVEAMAAGTPIIAFRHGATAEIIDHGVTGFIVDAGDIAQAAAHVGDLPAISRIHCRSHVAARFSLERMIDQYEEVYGAVARSS